MLVFASLREALRAGFQVEDRVANGYVVRTRTQHGWARAIVVVGKSAPEIIGNSAHPDPRSRIALG